MSALSDRKLTKRAIDAMTPGDTLWDSAVRGFCCRARTKRKIFYLKVRVRGRQKWLTIGEVGSPHTVETARNEAQRLLSELRMGVDVDALRYGGIAGEPLMSDLCERFLTEHARHH
ncbi:MAG: Arm DNA-binding domain-containing protein, partial [Pseudomonadota bacterium]